MDTLSSPRRYDLDWLRLLAITILLFYHTGMLFCTWDFHIKNSETSTSFNYWMVWFHYWRMPLLLFISGAGTYMALGKRTSGQFARERFRRLFIPLIFGMLVVVPPQIYFERIGQFHGYFDFYKTVFQFKPYPEGGSLSWHHLWFILYLFIYSMVALPFLVFLRSHRSLLFRGRLGSLLSRPAGILLIPSFLILATQVVLRPYFPKETHSLIDDWAFFTFYFSFFGFGMMCYSNQQLWEQIGRNRRYLAAATVTVLVLFYGCYFHFRHLIRLPWAEDTVELIFDVIAIFLSWFTVITVIAYGQHYLNKPHPWLSRINEALYPFYILHQTAIIAIGYYVCQLDWGIAAKFWTVASLALVSCIIFYYLFIRSNSMMRVLFGMKQRERQFK